MKKLYPLSVLLLSVRGNSTLITPKKLCKDCKFFIPNSRECSKFGDTDLVDGSVNHMYANTARSTERHCGPEATYFEPNKYKNITAPYYFVRKQWPMIAIVSMSSLYIYCLYVASKN